MLVISVDLGLTSSDNFLTYGVNVDGGASHLARMGRVEVGVHHSRSIVLPLVL